MEITKPNKNGREAFQIFFVHHQCLKYPKNCKNQLVELQKLQLQIANCNCKLQIAIAKTRIDRTDNKHYI